MRKVILLLTTLMFVGGCSKDIVKLNDYKNHIDSNTARILLLEAKDTVQDARLDALELKTDELDLRMSDAEQAIDANEDAISELFLLVADLDDDLSEMRDDLQDEIRNRKQVDRTMKREYRSKIRNLRSDLVREIRNRKRADNDLQSQIDDLESDVEDLSRRLSRDEFLFLVAFNYLSHQLNDLENNVDDALADLDNRLSTVEGDITTINNNLIRVRDAILDLQAMDIALVDAINTISLTPGPQGEPGIPGVDGIDGQDGGSGNGCYVEFRDINYHNNAYRADVYAVCSEGSIRLVNNQSIEGN